MGAFDFRTHHDDLMGENKKGALFSGRIRNINVLIPVFLVKGGISRRTWTAGKRSREQWT